MDKLTDKERYDWAKRAALSSEEFKSVGLQIDKLAGKLGKNSKEHNKWKDMNWLNFLRFVGNVYPFFRKGVLKFSNLEQYTAEERTRFFFDLWIHDIGREKLNAMEKLSYWPNLYVQSFNHPYIFDDSGKVASYWIYKDSESAWFERERNDDDCGGGNWLTSEEWRELQVKIRVLGMKGANLRACFLEKRAKEIYAEILRGQTVYSKEEAVQQIGKMKFFRDAPQWHDEKTTMPLKYSREFWGEYLLFLSRYKGKEQIAQSYLDDKNGLVSELKRIRDSHPEALKRMPGEPQAFAAACGIIGLIDEECVAYVETLCNQRVLQRGRPYYPWTWIVAAKQMSNPDFKISMQRSAKRNNENEKLQKPRHNDEKKRLHRGETEEYSARSIMKGIARRQEEEKADEKESVDFLLDEELLATHTNALNFALLIDTRENAERILNLYFYIMEEFSKLMLVPNADDFLGLAAEFRVRISGNQKLIEWYESGKQT